jgi:hypothetical protein
MMPEHHNCASSAPGAEIGRRVASSRDGVILNTRKRGSPRDPAREHPTPLDAATIVVVTHSPGRGDVTKRRIDLLDGGILASAKRDLGRAI